MSSDVEPNAQQHLAALEGKLRALDARIETALTEAQLQEIGVEAVEIEAALPQAHAAAQRELLEQSIRIQGAVQTVKLKAARL